MFGRYLENGRYRVHLRPEDITEEEVNAWERIASGPKRYPTEAECEICKGMYDVKQTTAGGADTVATTKHHHLPKGKEWHGKQYFQTTTDFPVASGKFGLCQARHQKCGNGRKMFAKSSDQKTRTRTLTYLKQRHSFGKPRAWFDLVPQGQSGWCR